MIKKMEVAAEPAPEIPFKRGPGRPRKATPELKRPRRKPRPEPEEEPEAEPEPEPEEEAEPEPPKPRRQREAPEPEPPTPKPRRQRKIKNLVREDTPMPEPPKLERYDPHIISAAEYITRRLTGGLGSPEEAKRESYRALFRK
jgi:hypothetical protein